MTSKDTLRRIHIIYWSNFVTRRRRHLKGRNHLGYLGTDGRIILKWVSNRVWRFKWDSTGSK